MRNRRVLLADLVLFALSAFVAFALRLDIGPLFQLYQDEFLFFVTVAVLTKPVVFYSLGLYRRYWQYVSLPEILDLAAGVATTTIVMAAAVGGAFWVGRIEGFPRSVLIIDSLVTLFLTGGLRIAIRAMSESAARNANRGATSSAKRVLVVGAGNAGSMVVREMQKNPQLGMSPVGFLDDEPSKLGKTIHGVPVIGTPAQIQALVRSRGVAEVLIAMPTAPGSVLRSLADACRQAGVPSRTLPGVYELLGGNVSVTRLRSVEIGDLIRRKQVLLRATPRDYLEGSRVIVTGAGGSIGLEMCRQIAFARPAHLVLLGHGENSIFEAEIVLRDRFPSLKISSVIADIRNAERVEAVFRRFSPAVVFHAAAHKHLPLMEDNPEEAISNNVFGTKNLASAAARCGVMRFVLVSTDKAVSPSSVMGASKRLAEMIVRGVAQREQRSFVVVRFGNVLGSRGSVVPIFTKQIERGGPVTVTHPEVSRFFMSIPEAVHLVLEAAGLGSGGELFVLNMGEPVKIADLVADLIRLSGADGAGIRTVYTGLRPGEKLREELWEAGSKITPTMNPDVLSVTAEPGDLGPADLEELLARLAAALNGGSGNNLRQILAEGLPSFSSTIVSRPQGHT